MLRCCAAILLAANGSAVTRFPGVDNAWPPDMCMSASPKGRDPGTEQLSVEELLLFVYRVPWSSPESSHSGSKIPSILRRPPPKMDVAPVLRFADSLDDRLLPDGEEGRRGEEETMGS